MESCVGGYTIRYFPLNAPAPAVPQVMRDGPRLVVGRRGGKWATGPEPHPGKRVFGPAKQHEVWLPPRALRAELAWVKAARHYAVMVQRRYRYLRATGNWAKS
jgi:hypothetical protein